MICWVLIKKISTKILITFTPLKSAKKLDLLLVGFIKNYEQYKF